LFSKEIISIILQKVDKISKLISNAIKKAVMKERVYLEEFLENKKKGIIHFWKLKRE